ncbi:MAG TPA: gliding motility-associated ABC transporter substrate-binding protein GldG [Bacteroidales bacterium]|nr:gliding motility-associated ABC transporter substrate-binding protein GldG [Bacteroidales bacterium]
MFTLFRKEISGFFSSLTGYVVVIAFLLANSLIMWIMPGQWNLLDSGYAGLDTLFVISPWLFLFLVPAVTMRLIAEEKRQGTHELLRSRPLGEGAIIYGKFFAAVALVLLSLLPCIVFVASVWVLGESPGNLDRGGAAGSFTGLFLLAAVYASIGIFSSSLTENQVVAFIIAVVISFIVWTGFESLALLPGLSSVDEYINAMGISEHYSSVSRGVLDIRDIAYFFFVTVLFNEAARFVLLRRKYRKPLTVIAVTALVALLVSMLNIRIDLTEDRRFTLADPSVNILRGLEKDVRVSIYLDGEMPVGFKKLKRTAEQYLDEFRVVSKRKVSYEFINPSASPDEAERSKFHSGLISRGLLPVNVMASDGEGGKTEKRVFPALTVTSGAAEIPVNFLQNNPALPPEVNLLHSAEGLEYEIMQAIASATADTVYKIAFIEGHGELDEIYVADITLELAKFFTIDRGTIGGKTGIIDDYAAIVIAGPTTAVDEPDKLIIDQYIMKGGRVMWLAEEVNVNADSLLYGGTVAIYEPLSFDDQLFRYGVRINPVLIQDTECLLIPLKISDAGGQPRYVPAPWIYYPLLKPSQKHPITRNLNRVKTEFANYLDTVGRNPEVKKTVLLTTSGRSRTVTPPVRISLDETRNPPPEEYFTAGELPVAILLEGRFSSAFENRMTESITGEEGRKIITVGNPSKMVVVADKDIIRNEVRWTGEVPEPLALGLDRYTMQTFGNKDFIVNCLNYLVNDNGLMSIRSREIKPRLLDGARIETQRPFWQMLNTVFPVLLIILAGLTFNTVRRRRYNRNK